MVAAAGGEAGLVVCGCCGGYCVGGCGVFGVRVGLWGVEVYAAVVWLRGLTMPRGTLIILIIVYFFRDKIGERYVCMCMYGENLPERAGPRDIY